MDKSIYTFTLGDKEVTLKFNWGGIKKLKNILDADPLTRYSQLRETVETVDFAVGVIEACSDLKKEDIDSLVGTVVPGDMVAMATKIMKAFNSAFSLDDVGGEADGHTQREEAA